VEKRLWGRLPAGWGGRGRSLTLAALCSGSVIHH
jgi:hypothetical protein